MNEVFKQKKKKYEWSLGKLYIFLKQVLLLLSLNIFTQKNKDLDPSFAPKNKNSQK